MQYPKFYTFGTCDTRQTFISKPKIIKSLLPTSLVSEISNAKVEIKIGIRKTDILLTGKGHIHVTNQN